MDNFDRAILDIVQRDNRLSNREIAERVNLSESAVRRRLDLLRAKGVIRADIALLDRDRLGVTLIVTVEFKDETPEAYGAFRERMRRSARVSQCYSIAGPRDFLVIAHARSLPEYEKWAETEIMADPAILRYDTAVVFSAVKFETAIPPEFLSDALG